MAGRGRESFEKRQRARARQERNREKQERREERQSSAEESPDVPEAALMADYGRLAERHEAGDVDDETFAKRKSEIFAALGIDMS